MAGSGVWDEDCFEVYKDVKWFRESDLQVLWVLKLILCNACIMFNKHRNRDVVFWFSQAWLPVSLLQFGQLQVTVSSSCGRVCRWNPCRCCVRLYRRQSHLMLRHVNCSSTNGECKNRKRLRLLWNRTGLLMHWSACVFLFAVVCVQSNWRVRSRDDDR